MGLIQSGFGRLDSRIKRITEQNVEQIQFNSGFPLMVEKLEDNNRTDSILAAILIIDIGKSTYLTENGQVKRIVKIYQSL